MLGAHTLGFNAHSAAIAVIGNYDARTVSPAVPVAGTATAVVERPDEDEEEEEPTVYGPVTEDGKKPVLAIEPPAKALSAVSQSHLRHVPASTISTASPGKRDAAPTAAATRSDPRVWGVA